MSKVKIAGTKYDVPPLNGVAGLEAAQILIPRLVEAQGAIDALVSVATNAPVDEKGDVQMDGVQMGIALSAAGGVGKALLPLLDPAEFVRLASLLTAVPEEELRKATLGELLDAAAVGLINADLRAVLAATSKIYTEVIRGSRGAPPAEAPPPKE
jgi:hypothetical protein